MILWRRAKALLLFARRQTNLILRTAKHPGRITNNTLAGSPWLFQSEGRDAEERAAVHRGPWYKDKTNKKRTRREREEEEEEEEIQDINTYTNTNLIPPRRFRSARYPITHKALITQLISIYLITPSLPGTISIGPGRESLPSSSPRVLPPAPGPSNLSLAPRSFVSSLSPAVLSILLANRRHAPAIRIPAECEWLARGCYMPRTHRGLHDTS